MVIKRATTGTMNKILELEKSEHNFTLIGSRYLNLPIIEDSTDYDFVAKSSDEIGHFLRKIGFSSSFRICTLRIKYAVLYEYKTAIDIMLIPDLRDLKFLIYCNKYLYQNSHLLRGIISNRGSRINFIESLFDVRDFDLKAWCYVKKIRMYKMSTMIYCIVALFYIFIIVCVFLYFLFKKV